MSRSRKQRNKGGQYFHTKEMLSDTNIGSKYYGYEFTNGNRGMARAVAGAKKFINSRRRFHEKMAIRKTEPTEL